MSNKIQSMIALAIVVAVLVAVAYFLVLAPLVEAQESTPGLTIGEDTCARTPLFLDDAFTGISGGLLMFIDHSKTVDNPTDSNIQFFPSDPAQLIIIRQVTFDVYAFVDTPQLMEFGQTNIHILSYCRKSPEDSDLSYYTFDDDNGDVFLVKFP